MKIGDIVRLKSGGPDLTVSVVYPNKHIDVQWFAGEELKQDTLHEDMLKLQEEKPSGQLEIKWEKTVERDHTLRNEEPK